MLTQHGVYSSHMFRDAAPVAFLRLGWDIVRREQGAAPALVLLTLLFFLALLLVTGSTGIAAAERLIRAAGDVGIELSTSASPERIDDLRTALLELPSVERAVIITRDESLKRASLQDPDLAQFLTSFQLNNPFPDTMSIRLRSADAYGPLVRFLQEPAWNDVVEPSTLSVAARQEHELDDVLVITRGAGALAAFTMGMVLLAIGAAVAAFVWRRAVDREEFSLPALLGIPRRNVLTPFAAEHTVLLLIALGIATLMLLVMLPVLPVLLPSLGEGGALAVVRAETIRLLITRLPVTVLVFALLCPVLAWIGVLPAMPDSRSPIA